MKELTLPSCDGKSQLHVILWEPKQSPVGIVQLSHGMIEYVERYDHFASFLNDHGYIVIGNDHIGHGMTAKTEESLGYFCESSMSQTVVDDLRQVTLWIQETYPQLPCILFGHSMGSFMARRYMMTYGKYLDGVILSGTGSQPKPLLMVALWITNIIKCIKGDNHRSKLLKKLFFINYDKQSKNDWLTRDQSIVDKYNQDPYCTYDFTVNGYRTLLDVLTYIQDDAHIRQIPKDLPVYFISGTKDPVGHNGKDITSLYHQYKNQGIQDVTMTLYEEGRHELVNELNKEEVFNDILGWLSSHGATNES